MFARSKRDMEFVSRKKCIEYYESQFPELPRYMIEMALDYDLAQGEGSSSNIKPLTNKEKRKAKKAGKANKPVKREVNELIKHAMETATPLEIECGRVVKAEDYKLPPHMPGYICVDGQVVADQIAAAQEPEPEPGEVKLMD